MERFEFVSMFVKYDWNVFLRYHISTNCTGESCYGDPGSNYVFNVNNRRTRARCETCPKLTITTPEEANSQHISQLVLVFLLLTLSRKMPTGDKRLRNS